MLVPRGQGRCADYHILDLPHLLNPGDLVVVNDTKVLPVRFLGTKVPGGGKVPVVLVKPCGQGEWEVLLKGRVRTGQIIDFGSGACAIVVTRSRERTVLKLRGETTWASLIDRQGQMPLPPYMKREPMERDREDYQTMFAKVEGAIAAPTAGLHFTSGLIRALELRGIQVVTLTLHVGIGTFRPVTTPTVEEHRMEPEWFDIPERTRKAIQQVRASGGRVVAVGTTVARSLETAIGPSGELCAQQSHTNLFITPGFQFRVVDVLFTNFHLPETTLVMLVAAFAGRDQARSAYEHAVKTRYRFYSYGDAMLIQ